MKRKRSGRPKKSAISQRRWLAISTAIKMRHAMELFRDFAFKTSGGRKFKDATAEGEAISRIEKAWEDFARSACCYAVQFDKPSEFLRQMADALEDPKRLFNLRDYQIAQAYWAPGREAYERAYAKASTWLEKMEAGLLLGEHCHSWGEFKAHFEKQFNGPAHLMPGDFVLRRSATRLGYYPFK